LREQVKNGLSGQRDQRMTQAQIAQQSYDQRLRVLVGPPTDREPGIVTAEAIPDPIGEPVRPHAFQALRIKGSIGAEAGLENRLCHGIDPTNLGGSLKTWSPALSWTISGCGG
jgi:hypothetical protein